MVATIPRARVQTIYGASHDVFLGPGSEQTLAAIQLFLFGLDGGQSSSRRRSRRADSLVGGAAPEMS